MKISNSVYDDHKVWEVWQRRRSGSQGTDVASEMMHFTERAREKLSRGAKNLSFSQITGVGAASPPAACLRTSLNPKRTCCETALIYFKATNIEERTVLENQPLKVLFYNMLSSNFKSRPLHIVRKLLKMSHLNFWILAFPTNFCPIKIDLSGKTVWPQAANFQKLTKMDQLWHF